MDKGAQLSFRDFELEWRAKRRLKIESKKATFTFIGVKLLLKSKLRSTFFPGVRGGMGTFLGDCGDLREFVILKSLGFVFGVVDFDDLPIISIKSSLHDARLSLSSDDSVEIGSNTGSTDIAS